MVHKVQNSDPARPPQQHGTDCASERAFAYASSAERLILAIDRTAATAAHSRRLRQKAFTTRFAGRVAGFAIFGLGMASFIGCNSSSSVHAGAVVVSIAGITTSGKPVSIAAGGKATVSMSPVNDSHGAGVDWTAICLGNPVTGKATGGACGTFSPSHTAAGVPALYTAPAQVPIGSTVTLSASVTSDPSATSTAVATIYAPAVSIAFASTPPASIQQGQQVTLSAQVTNDSTSAGLTWSVSCGSAAAGACGSFSSTSGATTIYTAPDNTVGSPVTITAASVAVPSVTVTATITINPAPAISVAVAPASFTLGAAHNGETANLIATVTGDSSDAGVDWSLQCTSTLGNCGSLTPATSASGAVITYKAPPTVPTGGTVIITATARASEGQPHVQSAVTTATITSTKTISVNVTAPPSLTVQGSTTLTATVTNDDSDAGVTWTVSCATSGKCGSVSAPTGSSGVFTATYTAPATIPSGAVVTITASPIAASPGGNPGLAQTTITPVLPSITFGTQPPATMTANTRSTVNAKVANDVAPGGVTWSVACGAANAWECGFVAPYQTASGANAVYTAPPIAPSGPVTLVASATATCVQDSCASSVSVPVTIAPATALSIGFVPAPPTQIEAATSAYLNAAVQNDSTSAGVDWKVCASGCGYFTVTPAIPPNPKTPTLPTIPAVTATTVKAWPNGVPILYTAPATPPTDGLVAIQATAHANRSAIVVSAATISTVNGGPTLNGTVMAGTTPVAGAQVALYAAGSSGYGSASTLVSPPGQNPFVTTDAHGVFTIPAGYGCPQATSQMYLVAIGGTTGSSTPNSALAMMTALGSCGVLSSSPVVVNEATTVGSVWALAPFAANPLTTGLNSYLNIGTSSGNATGLANAFAAVNNLVDISTGQPQFSVPAGNATVPYAEINMLADILNACTATAGGLAGDGTVCGNLLTSANPYRNVNGQTLYTGIPTDTLQASFEIAQNPDYSAGSGPSNVTAAIDGAALFALVQPGAPFQPLLSALPYDFSVSLNFTGGGGLSPASGSNALALDSSGNLWISNSATNSVTEWNNLGAPITSLSGYTTSTLVAPGPIAIDASGYVWICGQNGLTQLNFLGTEMADSPFFGGGLTTAGCQSLVMDPSQNIWAGGAENLAKFDLYGNPVSPAAGYTIAASPTNHTTVPLAGALAVDQSGNIWAGVNAPIYNGSLGLAELNGGSALPYYLSPQPVTGSPSNFVNTGGYPTETQIAIDAAGNVWGAATQSTCAPGTLFKVPSYKGTGTTDAASSIASNSGIDPFRCSDGVAVDGAGVIWTANAGGAADPLLTPPNVGAYNPSLPANTYGYTSGSLASGPVSLSVDASGNVWVLLHNNTVTEFIGVGTSAVTPLSSAVKNKKLGAKP